MTESLRIEINKFIFDAANLKTDSKWAVISSYEKLYKLYPNQTIDYVDFEWKYYQFYHGNQDLTIERSPENSSPVTFSDLPMDVLEKVVGKLDLVHCLALRKVCHDLRNLVDSSELYCERLFLDFDTQRTNIMFDVYANCYEQTNDGGCRVKSTYFWGGKKYMDVRNSQQVMLADVSTFLSNPKLKIGCIHFHEYEEGHLPGFLEFLKSLSFQLDVRSIKINIHIYTDRGEMALSIIQFLKPGRLEKINMFANALSHDEFNEIAETEQWKMAKQLMWNLFPNGFRMERLRHFEKIKIWRFDFSEENLTMLRDILLESPHLQSCYLQKKMNLNDERSDADERVVRIFHLPPPLNLEALQFRYNNSFHLELSVQAREISRLTIEKISEN